MLPFKKILCPTDFSEPAFVALKRAEELARHFAAELIVAHVIPPLPGPHSFPDPQASFNFDVPLYPARTGHQGGTNAQGTGVPPVSPKCGPGTW